MMPLFSQILWADIVSSECFLRIRYTPVALCIALNCIDPRMNGQELLGIVP